MRNVLYRLLVVGVFWIITVITAHQWGADLTDPAVVWATLGVGAAVGLWLTWPNSRADTE